MPDDELDELYSAKPDSFTALRRKLADAAKQRGQTAAAKRISAIRKPTTAAWIVNLLVLQHKESKQQLTDLRKRLRDAHAAMDGERIRRLSIEQRHLVDELSRAAFKTADVKNPSAALREDVTNTLQAAIADSDIAAQLGRLTKAEQWSGFGEFGAVAPVSTKPAAKPSPDAQRKRDALKAELAEAQRAQAEADRRLRQAERDLAAANEAYDQAKQASRDAAASVKAVQTRLRRQRE